MTKTKSRHHKNENDYRVFNSKRIFFVLEFGNSMFYLV